MSCNCRPATTGHKTDFHCLTADDGLYVYRDFFGILVRVFSVSITL